MPAPPLREMPDSDVVGHIYVLAFSQNDKLIVMQKKRNISKGNPRNRV
jgi:hypothetical protein